MRQAAPTHVSTLRDYLQVVRRRKWIIVEAVLIVPLAALAFSLHQHAQYQGSAQVLLSQQDLANQLTATPSYTNIPADRQAQTQAELARVPAVAQQAIKATRTPMSATKFLAASTATAGTNADLLTFTFTSPDPELASRLATAYARAYVHYRLSVDTAAINAALTEVENELKTLPSHGALYDSLVAKTTQLRTLAALKTANASVVRDAGAAVQTAPRTKRNLVLGVLLGLFLGVGLAFLREALDTRVRSAESIGERLELPLLARLPAPSKRLRAENRLAMLAEPSGVQAEAFRMLRTNLEFASLGKKAKIVMVTSATEQEGKSTTIANLAVALARSGKHVVLVDLDLRRPFVERFFDVAEGPGLTQVALGIAPLGRAITRVAISGGDPVLYPDSNGNGNGNGNGHKPQVGALDILPSGPIPPDPGEFVGTARLTEILEHLREHADIVLVDAPPLFHVGDGLVLSAKVDAVMVVTRLDAMRRGMLTELKRLLDTMPAEKLGFIVTGADEEESYGSGYAGYYYARPYERKKAETRA
ncbi:MAG TPA: Wzz/FepE/Etk N-terminal domain-containing protein [Microbacteriaceae bacterium]|nr:Wzz/FepE/Etk N-terminal domain-containing protein [Microbacteriaceae bacterium]